MRSAGYLENLKNYLRTDNDHLDVTLACEGNQQIKAHKVILSAGSLFFREVLSNAKHPEPFIFLGGGVRTTDLQSVLEYIYLGETNVAADKFEDFVKTARLLQVTGMNNDDEQLMDEYTGYANEKLDPVTNVEIMNLEAEHIEKEKVDDHTDSNDRIGKIIESEKTEHEKRKEIVDSNTDSNNTMDESIETKNIDLLTDSEEKDERTTFNPENEGIQKVDGLWECVKCGKTGLEKSGMIRHVQIHKDFSINIECSHCFKTLSTRNALLSHNSLYHSEKSAVCSICGKSDMTKRKLRSHMRNHNPRK